MWSREDGVVQNLGAFQDIWISRLRSELIGGILMTCRTTISVGWECVVGHKQASSAATEVCRLYLERISGNRISADYAVRNMITPDGQSSSREERESSGRS
jgi:hypothetical protein